MFYQYGYIRSGEGLEEEEEEEEEKEEEEKEEEENYISGVI